MLAGRISNSFSWLKFLHSALRRSGKSKPPWRDIHVSSALRACRKVFWFAYQCSLSPVGSEIRTIQDSCFWLLKPIDIQFMIFELLLKNTWNSSKTISYRYTTSSILQHPSSTSQLYFLLSWHWIYTFLSPSKEEQSQKLWPAVRMPRNTQRPVHIPPANWRPPGAFLTPQETWSCNENIVRPKNVFSSEVLETWKKRDHEWCGVSFEIGSRARAMSPAHLLHPPTHKSAGSGYIFLDLCFRTHLSS